MNKLDFLRKLNKHLEMLDKEERKEILAFYEERFYTGTIYENKTEEEVIAELERPEVIARNVLSEYGVSAKYVKTKEERYSNVSATKAVLLIAFDVFIASSVIPALFAAAVAIIGSTFSYIGTWGLVIGERSTVDEFTFVFITGAYILLFLFGLVVLEATLWLTRTLIKWHLNVFKLKNRDKYIKKLSHWSLDSWFKKHRGAKRVKNLALVFAIVAVVYTGYWIANHYDWVKAEYGAGEIVSDVITEDFEQEILDGEVWNIETNLENIDIEVVLVSGDDVIVYHSYYEDDDFTYNFDFDNNIILLENDVDPVINVFWDPSELFNILSGNVEIRIEVPADLLLGELDLETSNASIELKNVDAEELIFRTSNAMITLSNSHIANDINLRTSNSRIDVSNVEVGTNMYLHSSNGGIYVDDVVVIGVGDLTAKTTNSLVNISNVNFATYDISTSNGSIKLEDLNTELKDGLDIVIDTSNASIDMEDVYVDDIDAETSNADIKFINTDTTFHPANLSLNTSSYQNVNTNVTE
jgi:uncharacterized membrane protein